VQRLAQRNLLGLRFAAGQDRRNLIHATPTIARTMRGDRDNIILLIARSPRIADDPPLPLGRLREADMTIRKSMPTPSRRLIPL
jgi:hypothetical protein